MEARSTLLRKLSNSDSCRSHYSYGKKRQDLPLPLREHQRVAIIFPFSKRAQMHTPLIRLVSAVYLPNSKQDPYDGVFQCRTLPSDQVIPFSAFLAYRSTWGQVHHLLLAHLKSRHCGPTHASIHGHDLLNSKPQDAWWSTTERNLRGAVSPSSHVVLLFTPFFFGSLTTAGCLPLVCIPIHCTVLECGRRCLVPRGPHGAISGILAGGILGFGTADRFMVFAPSPRSCCDVWLAVFVLLQDPIHFPIHWHISCSWLPAPRAYKGGPNSVSKNHISLRCKKRTQKTSLLYLLVLIMTIFPFLLCWCKPAIVRFCWFLVFCFVVMYGFAIWAFWVPFTLIFTAYAIVRTEPRALSATPEEKKMQACNRGASRLGEAWAKPDEAWARPRLRRKTYWHKDKARLIGTRNYIILLLKSR